ncbi:MAG: hypothetical protein ACI932_001529, partial [Paracoccaceae bacterium]
TRATTSAVASDGGNNTKQNKTRVFTKFIIFTHLYNYSEKLTRILLQNEPFSKFPRITL